MIHANHAGDAPRVAATAYVHPSAVVIGKVRIGFKSVVFKASLGRCVVVEHQSLVEGVTIPEGLHVPSMTAVLTEEGVRRLHPATSELAAFTDKVRLTNIFLAEAS
jgi:carbonic anhydrase/acetyltransferase-like protein (isoleucine patch superfamily)